MDDALILELFKQNGTASLCSASSRARPMERAIASIVYGNRIAGRAKTARTAKGDNSAIHRAVRTAVAGEIVMVEAQGDESAAMFGDILATCCQAKGVVGIVIDGLVRDAAELRAMGFPVWCRGFSPVRPAKVEPGFIDVKISCGGISVQLGDYVVADDDGVIVIPRESGADVALAVEGFAAKENEIRQRILNGESSCAIFGIQP